MLSNRLLVFGKRHNNPQPAMICSFRCLTVLLNLCRCISSLKVVTISSGLLADIGTPALVSTVQVALDFFGKKYPTVCSNHTLHWEDLQGGDTMCDDQPETESSQNVLSRLYSQGYLDNDGPTVVISTACPRVFASIAEYAKEQDILALSFVESADSYRDKYRFPTLLSFALAVVSAYGTMFVQVMNHFNWKSVAVINDALSIWHGVAWARKSGATCQGALDALHQSSDITVTEVNTDSVDPNWIVPALKQASQHSRIIVVCTTDILQREVAAAAYDLNMTSGDYVFFHLTVTEFSIESPLTCCKNDSLDEKVREAFSSYFVLRSAPVPWNKMAWYTSAVSKRWLEEFGLPPTPWPYRGILGAEMILLAFEGLEATVQGIEKDMQQKMNYNFSGKAVAAAMWNKTFYTSLRPVSLDDAGMRVIYVELQQMNRSSLRFEGIAEINSATYSLVPTVGKTYAWKNGAPPPDVPACGLWNERCERVMTLPAVLGTVLAVAVIAVAAVLCLYSRLKQTRNLQDWAVEPELIELPTQTPFDRNNAKLASRIRIVNGIQTFICLAASENANPAIVTESPNNTKNRLGNLLYQVTRLHHENVNRLVAISLAPPSLFYGCCERGSVQDLQDSVRTDWTIKTSFLQDLVEGLNAIHQSPLLYHGNLKPTNCLVTQRFELKIGDLCRERLLTLLTALPVVPSPSEFTAPEIAKGQVSSQSDIYSLSAIVDKIIDDKETSAWTDCPSNELAPSIKEVGISSQLRQLVQLGRSAEPAERPSTGMYRKKLAMIFGKKLTVMESLMYRLQKQATDLESLVFRRQTELQLEQRKCDNLLKEMLPESVVRTLRLDQTVAPEAFDSVTIYVSYVAGFAAFVAEKTPFEVVNFLDDVYTRTDRITSKLDVYKLETINDSLLLVSGLPHRNGSLHCQKICNMSLRLLADFEVVGLSNGLALQIGLHTGPVVAAVVGLKRPRYCLFGDTINTASRMASHGLSGKIHLSAACADLANVFRFLMDLRGETEIKGKGLIRTYWLLSD